MSAREQVSPCPGNFADIQSLQLWIAAAETCVRPDPRAAAPVVAEQEAVGEKRKARA
jgi:hypothetical protein